jgi:hypothetical protein
VTINKFAISLCITIPDVNHDKLVKHCEQVEGVRISIQKFAINLCIIILDVNHGKLVEILNPTPRQHHRRKLVSLLTTSNIFDPNMGTLNLLTMLKFFKKHVHTSQLQDHFHFI